MKKFFLKFLFLTVGLILHALVMVLPVQAQHIAAGRIHSLYVDSDGNAWVWGDASLESAANERIPLLAMKDAQAVFADPDETLSFVIKKDGSLWGWGNNWYGQLGVLRGKNDRSLDYIGKPRQIRKDVTFVSGAKTVFVLKPDHTLWAWGLGAKKRGDGIKKTITSPVKIMNDVAQVSSSSTHTLALKKDGTLLAWGDNQCGALGIGNTKKHVKPVKVNVKALGKRKIAKIFARNGDSFIIADDGSVWNWGEPNLTYAFCHDEPRLTPMKLPVGNVKDIALGFRREIYLKKDGSVWEWQQDRHDPDTFTLQKILENVREIAAGEYHYIALKNDGTVWTRGNNQFGQIGDGTNQNAEDLVQVHFPKQ